MLWNVNNFVLSVEILMIGDDVRDDVIGAQRAGLKASILIHLARPIGGP